MKFEKVKELSGKAKGWLSERETIFMYEQAKKVTGKGVIVEIGSYMGKSTICIAGGSEENSKVKIYAIDPHMTDLEQKVYNQSESSLNQFKKNISDARLDYLVEPIVALSQDAVKSWNKPIEFLWIDGDHSYKGAKLDFDLWEPFLIEGGTVAFHDSNDAEVQQVLKECLFTKYFSNTGIAGSISFGVKRSNPISATQRIKNWSIYYLIRYYRIISSSFMPKGVKTALVRVGKQALNIAESK